MQTDRCDADDTPATSEAVRDFPRDQSEVNDSQTKHLQQLAKVVGTSM